MTEESGETLAPSSNSEVLLEPASFFADASLNQWSGSDDGKVQRLIIYVLTSLMAGVQLGPSPRSTEPMSDHLLDLWCSLSYILNTGTPADGHSSPNVAVTGQVVVEGGQHVVHCSVVTPAGNCSFSVSTPDSGPQRQGEGIHAEEPQPGDVETVISLFRDLNPKVEFKEHVRDVLTLLAYLLRAPLTKSSPVLMGLVNFTLCRTYRSIFERLAHGERLWGANPIRLMHARWHDPTFVALHTSMDHSINVIDEYVCTVLEQAGIASIGTTRGSELSKTTFLLNAQNAAKWADVMLSCLQDLERVFGPVPKKLDHDQTSSRTGGSGDNVGDGAEGIERESNVGVDDEKDFGGPHPPENLDSYSTARKAVRVLYHLVGSKAVARLLTPDLSRYIRGEYDRMRKRDLEPTAGFRHDTAAPWGADAEQAKEDDATMAPMDADELVEDFVGKNNRCEDNAFRYIASLAIPYSAPYLLFARCFQLPRAKLSMSIVTMTGSPAVDTRLIANLKASLKTKLQLEATEKETVDRLFRPLESNLGGDQHGRSLHMPLHAEAALMGAAYKVARGDKDAEDMGVVAASALPIGVSKKCCYCCALLGNMLNEWRLKDSDRAATYPLFILPGQHGTIHAWLPPAGLPFEVLQDIRDALYKKVEDFILLERRTKKAQILPSRSSSEHYLQYVEKYDNDWLKNLPE